MYLKMRTDIEERKIYKMRRLINKIIVTVCALSVVFTVASTSVFATMTPRSGPNDTASVTDAVKDSGSKDKTTSASDNFVQEPDNVVSQATSQGVSPKKYLTKWGGFFWFLLSVLVNFILSCWISNRFYKLAKRNTQGSAEIRALRKDIEEKFASTLTDINEPAIEVLNRNENYARSEDGIQMPDRRQSVEIKEEEREILGKWDEKRTAPKAEEAEEPVTYEMKTPAIEFVEEEKEEPKEEIESIPSRSKIDSIAKAGNRAKDFLSNIFPFED